MYDDIRQHITEECESVIESLIASVVSFLLSLGRVSSVVKGAVVYVPSLDHSFVVTLSCVDLVGISLWAFIFVFVVWVYVNLEERPMTRRRYAVFGVIGFLAFFLTNILRMFFEIFYLSLVGATYVNYLSQWQAFEEQVQIGFMFATFFVLLFGSYMILRRMPKIMPVDLQHGRLRNSPPN